MRRLAFISALLPRAAAFAPTGGVAASVRYLRAGAIASAAPDVDRYYTKEREPETRDFIMQQTMLRVKDPAASLAFYCDVLGFNLVTHREFEQWGFNVYFVAPVDPASIPSDPEERFAFCMRTPGCIELTWNYGSEGETGPVYNVGNGDATGTKDGEAVRGGFGHLGSTHRLRARDAVKRRPSCLKLRVGISVSCRVRLPLLEYSSVTDVPIHCLGITVPDVYTACARSVSSAAS